MAAAVAAAAAAAAGEGRGAGPAAALTAGRVAGGAAGRGAGFTLIELMIAIAIISVVAAIAIPNLVEARMSSNESAAISALKTIFTAQQVFQSQDLDRNGVFDFAASLGTLASTGALIDEKLASGERQGYRFELREHPAPENQSRWECLASPISPGRTGRRYFFVDQGGRIRANLAGLTPGPDGEVFEGGEIGG